MSLALYFVVFIPVHSVRVHGERLANFDALMKDDEMKDLAAGCPQGNTDPQVAEIQRVEQLYAQEIDSFEIAVAPDGSSWFNGGTPTVHNDWQAHTMMERFGDIMDGFADKKLVSQVWSNEDKSNGPTTPPIWSGQFWTSTGGVAGWASEFQTGDQVPSRSVIATSVPILGINRVRIAVDDPFHVAQPLVHGLGYGAVDTAVRKGLCLKDGVRTNILRTSPTLSDAWAKLTRAPANLFLTSYTSSARKVIRHGSLAFGLDSDDSFINEAVEGLIDILKLALVYPHAVAVPRVRFTETMARYPDLGVWKHAETGFIDDQIEIINRLKAKLAAQPDLISYKAGLETKALLANDVVQLRYTANAYGLDWTFYEDKKYTRQYNQPAFYTYLRWIVEDLKPIVQNNDLAVRKHLDDIRWDVYCVEGSKPILDTRNHDSFDELTVAIQSMIDNFASSRGRTETLQCWNRNVAFYIRELSAGVDAMPPAVQYQLDKLSLALDLMYQLQAQRKSNVEADREECGTSAIDEHDCPDHPRLCKPVPGCAPKHRTAELLQIAVLDSLMGVVTFVNCKSGLDRTGIYHAVQSAVDQLLILYPKCQSHLAFVAVHFRRITLEYGPSGSRFPLTFTPRGTEPTCAGTMQPLPWQSPRDYSSSWYHVYDLFRNAVLKNMLDVGRKITFASTGMAGFKYAGYTAQDAAAECLKHKTSQRNQAASCDEISSSLLLGKKSEGNPMVAPFLPDSVNFRALVPGDDSPKTMEMPLSAWSEDLELYIANIFADDSYGALAHPMTASGLLQDASSLRGS